MNQQKNRFSEESKKLVRTRNCYLDNSCCISLQCKLNRGGRRTAVEDGEKASAQSLMRGQEISFHSPRRKWERRIGIPGWQAYLGTLNAKNLCLYHTPGQVNFLLLLFSIHSLSKCLLCTCHMPGACPGTGNTVVNKIKSCQSSFNSSLYFLLQLSRQPLSLHPLFPLCNLISFPPS